MHLILMAVGAASYIVTSFTIACLTKLIHYVRRLLLTLALLLLQ